MRRMWWVSATWCLLACGTAMSAISTATTRAAIWLLAQAKRCLARIEVES